MHYPGSMTSRLMLHTQEACGAHTSWVLYRMALPRNVLQPISSFVSLQCVGLHTWHVQNMCRRCYNILCLVETVVTRNINKDVAASPFRRCVLQDCAGTLKFIILSMLPSSVQVCVVYCLKVTDVGVKALADNCPNLTSIDLRSTKVRRVDVASGVTRACQHVWLFAMAQGCSVGSCGM
jgi:hypothetical protein